MELRKELGSTSSGSVSVGSARGLVAQLAVSRRANALLFNSVSERAGRKRAQRIYLWRTE